MRTLPREHGVDDLRPVHVRGAGPEVRRDRDESDIARLVEANLRFVVSYAKRYRGFGVSTLDLIHAGNLGLMVLATGGVFVAGGIAPRVLPFLQRGGFREAFDRKGRLHTLVERLPAYVVTHAQPGLLGAAKIAASQ